MKKNFSVVSDRFYLQKFPITLIKHRTLKTDPVYKFVINANVYFKSNVPIKQDDNYNRYYDILNILAPSDKLLNGLQWLTFIQDKYDIVLATGTEYFSNYFNELGFSNIPDRNLFDEIYTTIQAVTSSNDGVNIFLDFSLQLSGGFVRNKLGIDTSTVKSWLLDNLSFNFLSLIMDKEQADSDYKVISGYKDRFDLNSDEVLLLESLLKYNSPLMPVKTYSENISMNYFWDLLNSYSVSSLSGKQNLFGFMLNNVQLTNIRNKHFDISVSQNNLPLNIAITQNLNSLEIRN